MHPQHRHGGGTGRHFRVTAGASRSLLARILFVLLIAGALPGARSEAQTLLNPVENLRLVNIFMPWTLRFEWDAPALGSTYEVRTPDGTTINTTNTFYEWLGFGARFSVLGSVSFEVRVVDGGTSTPSGWTRARVHPFHVSTSENQAVDSRLDRRYGNIVYQDYKFGQRTYRGGLYAGYAPDNSNIGRSFFKLALPLAPAVMDIHLFPFAYVSAYHTRSLASGSTDVAAHEVSTAWTAADVVWTNAPALGSALNTQTLSYDSNAPNPGWRYWNVQSLIQSRLGTTMGVGLAAANESAPGGWAYFAKTEYDATKAPCALYAFNEPQRFVSLSVPSSIVGGKSASGTITMRYASAHKVTLTSSDPMVAVVPEYVITRDDATETGFAIVTFLNAPRGTVTITATWNGVSHSQNLTVDP